jgi:hypothetical protein
MLTYGQEYSIKYSKGRKSDLVRRYFYGSVEPLPTLKVYDVDQLLTVPRDRTDTDQRCASRAAMSDTVGTDRGRVRQAPMRYDRAA